LDEQVKCNIFINLFGHKIMHLNPHASPAYYLNLDALLGSGLTEQAA
jgi:hypothetical protein